MPLIQGIGKFISGSVAPYLLLRLCTVNTFTEHHGSGWSVKDMQHTYVAPPLFPHCLSKFRSRVMGVLWWAGGLLGILLSRKNQVCRCATAWPIQKLTDSRSALLFHLSCKPNRSLHVIMNLHRRSSQHNYHRLGIFRSRPSSHDIYPRSFLPGL